MTQQNESNHATGNLHRLSLGTTRYPSMTLGEMRQHNQTRTRTMRLNRMHPEVRTVVERNMREQELLAAMGESDLMRHRDPNYANFMARRENSANERRAAAMAARPPQPEPEHQPEPEPEPEPQPEPEPEPEPAPEPESEHTPEPVPDTLDNGPHKDVPQSAPEPEPSLPQVKSTTPETADRKSVV